MSVKDRLIQFVLRGKDELSPAAEKSAEALAAVSAEADELGKALDSAKDAVGLAKGLDATQKAAEQAERSLVQTDLQIRELRDALNAAPEAAGVQRSLKDAEREARRTQKALDGLRVKLGEQEAAARAAGIDTRKLADEEKRLALEVDKAKTALSGNAAAAMQLKREHAAAARTTAELEQKVQGAAKAARELLNGQREGATATQAHSTALAGGVRQLAAYAAGFFGLTVIIGRVTAGIRSMLQTGDQFELLGKRMTALMGSIGAGEQATGWIKDFARDTPLALADVAEAFSKLKAFGIDPMDGTLQALVDQNEKLGGGMERLQGIVGAVGQAWAKTKLQSEEILQLVERGVPAWDLLAKVTGKNGAALQEMATKGELGRDVIKQLVEEIGRSSKGAAADSMSTLTGLVSNLGDAWTDFLNRAANSGALDYVKGRLQAVSDAVARMSADGSLDRMAKRFSDSFVAVAKSVEGAGQWIARHTTEIKALAAAYAAFKLAGMVASMARWATTVQLSSVQMRALALETNAAAAAQARLSAAQVLGGGMAKLGAGIASTAGALLSFSGRLAGWAGVALLAADAGKPLGEWLAKMSPAVKEAEASIARMNETMRSNYEAAKDVAAGLQDAAGVQIKAAADLRTASETERQAYAERLTALQEYQKAQLRAALYGREVGQVTEDELAKAQKALADTRQAFADLDAAATFSANALKGRLTDGALALVEQFTAIRRGGEDVSAALEGLGKSFDPRNADQLRDMGVTLQYLGQYGLASGEQIEEFLIAKLSKLSGDELVKVQQVAQQVFAGLGRGAEAAGLAMDASLNTALARLGLDLEGIKTGFDKGTRDIIKAFDGVIASQVASGRSAEENAQVITAAYAAARAKINNPDALSALDAAFKGSAQTAGLSADAIRAGMDKARDGVSKTTREITGMEDALGKISAATNGMELANIGVAASRAFHEGRMSAEQYAKVQEALRRQTIALRQATADSQKAQDDKNDSDREAITTSEQLRRESGKRMEAERKAGDQAMQDRRRGSEEAKKDMSSFEGFFGGVLSRAREPLAAMSAAALAAYDRLRGLRSVDVSIDTSNLKETVASLQKVTDALGAVRSAISSPFTSSLGRWALETQQASLVTQQAYLGQKARLQDLMESYARGDLTLKRFVGAASSARSALGLLDDSDLSALDGALKAAQESMEQMGEATRTTLESLQDELDGLQGRQDDIERRRFAARRRELEAQLAEANAGGNAQAQANASRALGMLRQIEAETAQQRQRTEQETRIEANKQAATPAPAVAATPSKIIRLELKGKSVDVAVSSAADETNLLSILEDAALRAL